MGRIVKIPFILIAVAGLSACGGSATSVGPPPTTPIQGNVAGTAGGSTVTGTAHGVANGNPVAMTIGGTTITGLVRDTTYDKGVLKAFVQSAPDPIAGGTFSNYDAGHSGESSTGAMSASVMNTDFTSAEAGGILRGANYARVSGGTMPTTGGGDFTGDYAGGMGASNVSAFIITGDVTLTADFGASTIFGSITNRVGKVNILGTPNGFADVDLVLTGIGADGAFSGTATGGEFITTSSATLGTVTSNTSTYQGLIGGATGTEAAGAVKLLINYDAGGIIRDTTEVGVFIAE